MSTTFERETTTKRSTKLPPLSEPPKEAQILELAADILDTEGWMRGNYAAFGNRCAVGGIGAAMKRLSFKYGEKGKSRQRAEEVLANLIRQELVKEDRLKNWWMHSDKNQIITWNDHLATGKTTVVRKMREAAASLTRTGKEKA